MLARWFLLFLAMSLFSPRVSADDSAGKFFVAPSLFYYTGLRSRSSKEKQDYLVYDLKAAYNVADGFFAGLAYQVESEKSETSGYAASSLNSRSESERTSWGPSFGYVMKTFHATLTYYYDSKWKLDTTTSTGSTGYAYKGWGFQLDVGYKIELWKMWFGPQLSYKKFEYKKLTTDGGAEQSISPKLEDTAVEPSLVFFFFF